MKMIWIPCFLLMGLLLVGTLANSKNRKADSLATHILKTRGKLLQELPGPTTMEIIEFVAIPDDGVNGYDALQLAVAYLSKYN